MRLMLIRHGLTDFTATGRYSGQMDVSLNGEGHHQAEVLGQRLARYAFATLVTSDLARARATAEAIAQFQSHTHLVSDPDLREIAMGMWEGATYTEIAARDPKTMADWQADPVHHAPPGGETLTQMLDRVTHALDRWYVPEQDAIVAWVTHGGVIRALTAHLLGISLSRQWSLRADPASLSEIAYDREGTETFAVLTRWNDVAHLDK